MVTHWESSRRPLFVRTVWRDGQHHVVLHKEEDPDARRNTAPASAQHSARTARSANLKAVKLLLAGVGNFTDKKLSRCKSSDKAPKRVEAWTVLPQRPVTSRNANKEVPDAKAHKNLNLSLKSSSIDLDGRGAGRNKVGSVAPYFSYHNYVEQGDNTLSERVMIWLDLATQNAKDNAIECQRIVTACRLTQKRRKSAAEHTNSPANYSDLSGAMGPSQAVPSGAGEQEIFAVSDKSSESDEAHPLSSEVQDELFMEQIEEHLPKNKIRTAKRQLHIFMPNLPKKFSDCDSSILSSCSLPRSVNSRKL